jgi:hypothetical protein
MPKQRDDDDLYVTEYRPAMTAPPRPGDYAIITFRDPCGRQWQERVPIARWHFGGAKPGVDLPIDEHERALVVQIMTPLPPPRPVEAVTMKIGGRPMKAMARRVFA